MGAYIIVDLGFGDAGKGLLTDFLTRHLGASLIVRYNGGAQAGHNVVTPDGRHHTFSQFGAGMFVPGVKTYLSRYVVIHPTALLVEGDLLQKKGVADVYSRLRVSEQAIVITPFHQAANRIREILRGKDRHGSCGVGVGEAVEDALFHPEDTIRAGDLLKPSLLRRKMQNVRERKHQQVAALGSASSNPRLARESEIFERDDVIERWMVSIVRIAQLGLVASDSVLEQWLHTAETVIFEGAQGVLLDAEAGFHPYTTWSNCTAKNALEVLAEMAPHMPVIRLGVMRSYAVRHGAGPLPTETETLRPLISEHNQYNEWQGAVRYGWFDAVLARYALQVTGGVDVLALTHLDLLPRLENWKYCPAYQNNPDFGDAMNGLDISGGLIVNLQAQSALSLEQRTHLTQILHAVQPVLKTCPSEEKGVIRKIESLIGQAVDIVARGPRATDVQGLTSLPA